MYGRKLAYSLLLMLLSCSLFAQKTERKDSLVRLLGCNVLQQIEDDFGTNYRKAIGKVRFEHNSTLLICDTALWNVNAATIKANGNVRIIQNRTVLSSDELTYYIESNLAQFRGTLVQLQDKDKNTLRTKYLDYNTKDSVATFVRGGALKDKDGQLIESDNGTYDSKIKTFTFFMNVNMYTDSVLVKTKSLEYNTGTSIATFGADTYAWREDNMLSAQAGWYDRNRDVFTFVRNVHLMTEGQEAWADTLVYNRVLGDAELKGNAELLDSQREIAAVGGYMQYIDSLQYIKLARDPAVIIVSEQKDVRDTVYVGADELIYWTVPKCDIPSWEISKSDARVKSLAVDAITEYRKKAAEAAKAAAEEAKKKAMEDDPNAKGAFSRAGQMLPAPWDEDIWLDSQGWNAVLQTPDSTGRAQIPDSTSRRQSPDSTSFARQRDSISVVQPRDSSASAQPSDSLSNEQKDTTRIGFLIGKRNVRIFRKDMQVACDSLAYTDLDSLVRLYRSPIVWNEIRRQYSADSITVVMKDRALERASLMSNAFIAVQEDSVCFDQIKGAEMMAYFDTTGALSRFDAMGGSSGLFFIEEQETLATVNKFEAKMLTATFKEGNLYDLNYFEEVKSNAYPIVQLKREDRSLKGFEWQPDKRPKGPEDVTSYVPRQSERSKFEKVSRPSFKKSSEYFPGYMDGVIKELDRQFELKKARQAEKRRLEEEAEEQAALEAQELPDVNDEGTPDEAGQEGDVQERDVQETDVQDGDAQEGKEEEGAVSEEVKPARDTVKKFEIPVDPKEQLRAQKKAEQKAKRAEREKAIAERAARKEAKWAALDARDAEKAARKAEKKLKKQRAKTLKMLEAKARQDAREQKIIDKYKARYEKQKARKEQKQVHKKQ